MKYPICIASFDIGSSAVKAVLVSRDGALHVAQTVSYPHQAGVQAPGEQDPRHWWLAFIDVLNRWWADGVEPEQIVALSFSGQMQCMAPVDANGQPVRAAILHADARAQAQADALIRLFGPDEIERVTRNPFTAGSVLPKMLWLAEHEADAADRCAHVLVGAKDVVIQRLTGRCVTDPTTAATTGMFNLERGTWEAEWLTRAGLPTAWLPELVEPNGLAGRVSAAASAETGLIAGCPVISGLGDAAATTLGAGVVDAGESYAYLGTSGWVARVSPEFNPPGAPLFLLPYLDDRRRIRIGPVSNAGGVHRWALGLMDATAGSGDATRTLEATHASEADRTTDLADNTDSIGPSEPRATEEAARFAAFEAIVRDTPTDPRVVFLPYLGGERFPITTAGGDGVFHGLSVNTTRPQMMRAALEGVSLSLRWALETLDAQAPTSLVAVGGGTRSRVWMQILADAFDAQVRVLPQADLLPCLGAAAMAASWLGWCDDPASFVHQAAADAATGNATSTEPAPASAHDTFDPAADAVALLQAKSQTFRRLHHALTALPPNPAKDRP